MVLLRLPLREYSLGHELILTRRGNPLLLDSVAEISPGRQIHALREAVWICSHSWAQNERDFRPATILHRLFSSVKCRFWCWLTRRENYPMAIAEFRNYLAAAHVQLPAPTREAAEIASGKAGEDEESHGRELGAPLLANLIWFAATHLEKFLELSDAGSEIEELRCSVYDLALAKVANFYFVAMEEAGRLRIENRDEAAARLELETARAEAIAEELAESADSAHPAPYT